MCLVVSKVTGTNCRESGEGVTEEEEEQAAEAQGWEAVWDGGDGGQKDEVQLCRLGESDVG